MIWVFALLLAAPAAAREGGPIRTGEHPGFTRVVMEIEPATEWSLETLDGTAVIRFPGRAIDFGTEGVWERIPRARVTSIAATRGPEGARVTLGLGCDCRVTASFVGARRLAIDVIDRGAVVPVPPARETEVERDAREGEVVASAEAALAAQIVHAADQGVVQLTGAAPVVPAPSVAPVPAPPARPEAPAGDLMEAEAEPALTDQIAAISVYDRDDATLAALRAAVPPPSVCLPDEAFDLGAWSDGTGYSVESAKLTRRVVGEFDRPDPEALRALVRLRIRYGFGLEAGAELAAFEDADLPDRALLADLARVVEGRAPSSGGALALAEDCPGNHALWLALGGAAPAWRGPIQFAAAQEAFAALPPDLRALLGPGLAARLLDQERKAEAATIVAISLRPGLPETPEQALVAARLKAAEGAPAEALALLRGLAESGAPIASQALATLARIAFDQGVALPDRMMTDLAGAAAQARGGPEEAELRGLLVASLGVRGALREAVAEASRGGDALPAARDLLAARAVAAVAAADPAEVGGAAYAEAALAAAPTIATGVAMDPDRRAIAGRLIALGLPNAALDLLAPATLRGDPGALRLVAAAALALGRPAEAEAAVTGLTDPEAVRLRAAALAAAGQPDRAVAALVAAGVADEAGAYAWVSGDWARAGAAATDDPARVAMAAYMAGRGAPRSGPAPEALTPEAAFALPPPALARPSLGAARDLIASSRQLDDFLGAVLAEGAEP